MMNWESFHQYLFKINFSLSPLNIHLLQITLRENSSLIFLHLRKTQKNNWLHLKNTWKNLSLTLKTRTITLLLCLQNFIINLIRKLENSYIPCQYKSQSFHPNRVRKFKMKRLLSPLNIHLMNKNLRENPKKTFFHLIKYLNKQNNNW